VLLVGRGGCSLLLSWSTLMERSLIWSALGRMSKQGLLPMPIEDISAILTALFLMACFHSNWDNSSVQAFFTSSDIDCSVNVSFGFRFLNQISNLVGLSPIFAVSPMSVILILFL
jgi:hypothetical protein